ncbi:hypothetical protein [Microbulbifer variabilis]|uniref:hypothetical protein n=1 Tax=Microbulbifer variabilis TaxID=266805 RepID=UPI00037F2BD1|nr:hypothetical protein [Microbulbifer variabilis]
MKSFLINLIGLVGSWYLIDLASENPLNSTFAPFVFAAFLISSLLWFIVKFGVTQRSGFTGDFGGGDSDSFGGGGGDVGG